MTYKKISLLLVSAIIMLACQKENTSNDIVANSTSNLVMQTETDAQFLERNMQWMSFITTKTLRHNAEAQDEFLSLIDTYGNRIPVEELIGDNANASAFAAAFEQKAMGYINTTPTGDEHESPPPPAGSRRGDDPDPNDDDDSSDDGDNNDDGDGSSNSQDDENQKMANFYNLLLVDNCLELFMPVTISFEGEYTLTSGAHPLKDLEENYGYARYFNDSSEEDVTEQVLINQNYINQNPSNIIITRPVRNDICDYPEYEIDFTNFLN